MRCSLGWGSEGVVVPGHHDGVVSARLPRGIKGTQVSWNMGFALHRLGESLNFSECPFFFNLQGKDDTM